MDQVKQYRTARKKHHVIYRTVCLATGRYYIGMHSTDNLDDGYMGSGKRLWQSIKKHGLEQHRCEIIEHLPSREALRRREAEIVNEELIGMPMCMNLALGGQGGWSSEQMKAIWSNPDYAVKQRSRTHSGHTDNTTAALHEAALKQWADPEYRAWKAEDNRKSQQLAVQSALSPEARAKRKSTLAAKKHSQGMNNPNFGKRWMHNPHTSECRSVKINDAQSLLDAGWVYGRTRRTAMVSALTHGVGKRPTHAN